MRLQMRLLSMMYACIVICCCSCRDFCFDASSLLMDKQGVEECLYCQVSKETMTVPVGDGKSPNDKSRWNVGVDVGLGVDGN